MRDHVINTVRAKATQYDVIMFYVTHLMFAFIVHVGWVLFFIMQEIFMKEKKLLPYITFLISTKLLVTLQTNCRC